MVEKQGFDLKVTCEIDTAQVDQQQNIFEPSSVSDQELLDKFSQQDNPDFEKESSVTNSQWAIFTNFSKKHIINILFSNQNLLLINIFFMYENY